MDSNVRILVADDDAEDRLILIDSFTEVGFTGVLDCVENGIEAISYLRDAAAANALPSIIVLDLNMPRLNGTETLRQIKSHSDFNVIPVVIFSTSVNEIEKEECLRLGATSYMTKPSTQDESLDTARYFCEFAEKVAAKN
ncbi:MAG: response regulator [Sphingobacteriales bacterium]|nr:MAG: response regulator [Sphingobacteriales bacterium]